MCYSVAVEKRLLLFTHEHLQGELYVCVTEIKFKSDNANTQYTGPSCAP
jgi:hypothetical protein